MSKLKYTYDSTVFDGPLTREAAYFTGLLVSDGSLAVYSPNSGRLSLTLTDKDSVEKFRAFLKTDLKVRTRNPAPSWTSNGRGKMYYTTRKPQYSLSISCTPMVPRLNELGLYPNKTLNAYIAAEVADNCDFWRGMIDGDGCLTDGSKPRLRLDGTLGVCNAFRTYCAHIVPIDEILLHHGHASQRNYYQVEFTGKHSVTIMEHLYRDAPEQMRMERKYEIAMSFVDR